jgi:hypothetical protein
MSRRIRNEGGAVAVMFALLAVVFMSIAAMGVDLGNAWQAKRQVQAGSDLATEAGAGIKAANLPSNGTVNTCSYGAAGALATDQSVKDIASYLASQAYPSNTGSGYSSMLANLPGQLTDCDMSNGEVVYGTPKNTGGVWQVAYNKNQLSLVAPPKKVDFGLAGIMGFHSVNVNGVSTVEIRSPKMRTLPFYGFSGCDYGPQTLQQPNNGQSASTVNLANSDQPSPASQNTATLTSVSPPSYPVDNTPTPEPITLIGTNLTGVQQIGFFESGNATVGPSPVISTTFNVVSDTKITMADIPSLARGVAGVQEFWYIRVMKNGQWSSVYVGNGGGATLNTPILTIGVPPLVCGQGSSAGNFGTIKLSHAGYTGWDNIGAANVALGLDSTLSIYPQASRPADGTCSTSQPATILWTAEGTNCVDTDTGMSSDVATGGFIGIGSSKVNGGTSYLLKPTGKTTCGAGGSEATTSILGQAVNNDTLTCFFTDPNIHVGDIDTDPTLPGAYTGPAVISDKIYDSPRFGYVPILPVQPTSGGSNKYQIIDFRACFITDQTASAQFGATPSATNGINMDSNGVHSVQVIFLNPNALPDPVVKNGTINYVGSGPKAALVVN